MVEIVNNIPTNFTRLEVAGWRIISLPKNVVYLIMVLQPASVDNDCVA